MMKKIILIGIIGLVGFGAGYLTSVILYQRQIDEMESEMHRMAGTLYGFDENEMRRFIGSINDLGPEEAVEFLHSLKKMGPEYAELQRESRILATLAGVKYFQILEERDVATLRRRLYFDIQQFYDYFADLAEESPSGPAEAHLHRVMNTIRQTVEEIESKYNIETGEQIDDGNSVKPSGDERTP